MKSLQSDANTSQAVTTRRGFMKLAGVMGVLGASSLFGCAQSDDTSTPSEGVELDSAAWKYDADNDIYYQIGVQYCANPQAESYESMGIYVPGAYFSAEDNGDGTFPYTPSNDFNSDMGGSWWRRSQRRGTCGCRRRRCAQRRFARR